nr:putative GH32 family protein [Bemisia tabaci]
MAKILVAGLLSLTTNVVNAQKNIGSELSSYGRQIDYLTHTFVFADLFRKAAPAQNDVHRASREPRPQSNVRPWVSNGLIAVAILTLYLWPSVLGSILPLDQERWRPRLHYSPPYGFMNDPNGLVEFEGEYHLFYQCNPYAPIIGHVHWCHAVSRDLIRWETLQIALYEDHDSMPFSGSCVVFNDSLVAVYTRAYNTGRQTQNLAISYDNGRTFEEYSGNPVIDRRSSSFRDPQVTFMTFNTVFYHNETGEFKMAVALASKHVICFYGSTDLIHWRMLSTFELAGLLGINWECPNLVRIPTEGGGHKWVLFISINPGAPQGGSTTQYFVGDFDGTTFTPDNYATKPVDFGKDNYALQFYSNIVDPPTAIAWLSNWQYCNETPTATDDSGWRGVQTLARTFKLVPTADNGLIIAQKPILDSVQRVAVENGDNSRRVLPKGNKPLEIHLEANLTRGSRVILYLKSAFDELLQWGYDANNGQLWLDRAKTYFKQRFFTDKVSAAVIPESTTSIDIYAIYDGCAFEMYAANGTCVCSSLVFFKLDPVLLQIEIVGEGNITNLTVNTLSL